jgi:hypothetical protein
MKITLTEFKSSLLEKVSFNRDANILEVKFLHSDTIYAYKDFEVQAFKNLLEAESLGSHFSMNIRNSYPFEKLETPSNIEFDVAIDYIKKGLDK